MLNEKVPQNEAQNKHKTHKTSLHKPRDYGYSAVEGLTRLTDKRRQRFEIELRANPPEPPWEKHPGYARTDRFWRTGVGNQYLIDYIWLYNRYSTKAARKQYRQAHPEPENWKGWYSE